MDSKIIHKSTDIDENFSAMANLPAYLKRHDLAYPYSQHPAGRPYYQQNNVSCYEF